MCLHYALLFLSAMWASLTYNEFNRPAAEGHKQCPKRSHCACLIALCLYQRKMRTATSAISLVHPATENGLGKPSPKEKLHRAFHSTSLSDSFFYFPKEEASHHLAHRLPDILQYIHPVQQKHIKAARLLGQVPTHRAVSTCFCTMRL